MQECDVFVLLPISMQKQKINHGKACNPLHADYKECLSTDVQFTFMKTCAAPGEGTKSQCHLTTEILSLARLHTVNADCWHGELPHFALSVA